MILVDSALAKRMAEGRPPIRVAMTGAGFMARGIALQIATIFGGCIRIAGIGNRTAEKGFQVYREAGDSDPVACTTLAEVRAAVAEDRSIVTNDAKLLIEAGNVDVLLEVTGAVEMALPTVLAAIDSGKHVILMNAELDGTVGPLLKAKADAAGVIYTNADGDQPGVIMNLYRFVKGIGLKPVLCGNIKGLQDPYRTPTTQAEFARRWGQSPSMVTSFADGTKIAFEQAIVANATGMQVAKRGMYGFSVEPGTSIEEAARLFPIEALDHGPGIVDYVVGAAPSPGVFVLGTIENERQRHYLSLYKLGDGPLYCFYTPYHLCHFEVPNTIARAVLFGDAAVTPIGRPYVDVITVAKRDLSSGEEIDGLGGYMTYGVAENSDIVASESLLPMGVAAGCRLVRSIGQDTVLTYADVVVPPGRLVDRLRFEQASHFSLPPRPIASAS